MNNVVSLADRQEREFHHYRLGVHLIRITYENDRFVQCERFDLETLEMVVDWRMLVRVEASLEVDRLTPYEFSLEVQRIKGSE